MVVAISASEVPRVSTICSTGCGKENEVETVWKSQMLRVVYGRLGGIHTAPYGERSRVVNRVPVSEGQDIRRFY